MKTELSAAVKAAERRVGVAITLYSASGAYLCGTKTFDAFPLSTDFSDVLENDALSVAAFRVRSGKSLCFGTVEGKGEEGLVRARLVAALLESMVGYVPAPSQNEELLHILTGISGEESAERFAAENALPALPVFVLLFPKGEGVEDLPAFLTDFDGGRGGLTTLTENGSCAHVRFWGADLQASYRSPFAYAATLVESIYRETGKRMKVGVGNTVTGFAQVSASFLQAEAALSSAKSFQSDGAVQTFRQFMAARLLEEAPAGRLRECYNFLSEAGVKTFLAEAELLRTAQSFLECDLNVSETARALYLHRNTLLYRLEKIESLTGLNIRRFDHAVTMRLALVLHALTR